MGAVLSEASMYRYQASCLLAEAEIATLSNVRDRCHAAAEAWIRMAERIERTAASRAEEQVIKTLKTRAL